MRGSDKFKVSRAAGGRLRPLTQQMVLELTREQMSPGTGSCRNAPPPPRRGETGGDNGLEKAAGVREEEPGGAGREGLSEDVTSQQRPRGQDPGVVQRAQIGPSFQAPEA